VVRPSVTGYTSFETDFHESQMSFSRHPPVAPLK
jgi:hypothetical protein